jgi:hypothetical protein
VSARVQAAGVLTSIRRYRRPVTLSQSLRYRTLRKLAQPCLRAVNLRRTLAIAVVVGCVLTLINQGDVIFAGDATRRTVLKIVMNFVVPFVVSNLGVISGTRAAGSPPASTGPAAD